MLIIMSILLHEVKAQAPNWQLAVSSCQSCAGTSLARASAVDGSGNVFVTGEFTGTVRFGTSTLVSVGGEDVFLAKWNTTTRMWTWAASGGGRGSDSGQSIAVSGSNVYITGLFQSTGVPAIAGQSLTGAGGIDVFVAKYVDGGGNFTNGWATSGGGAGNDGGRSIAVNGSNVYVTGSFDSNTSFRIAGQTLIGMGSDDVFIAKYIDTGSTTFSNSWATGAGGSGFDYGFGVAVSGSNVFITGAFDSNTNASIAGQMLVGAGLTDIFVGKYIDTGTSFTNGWATSSGGSADDVGASIAVNGSNVYVTGGFSSNTNVNIAGQTLAGAGASDIFLAKYIDTGIFTFNNGWAVGGGGTGPDVGNSVSLSGSNVYITGSFSSNANTQLAGQSLVGMGNQDMFLAKYIDTGGNLTNGWAISGGGTSGDLGLGVAISGGSVIVIGGIAPPATFGNIVLGTTMVGRIDFLAALNDPTLPTSVTSASAPTFLALSPNPTNTTTILTGAMPHLPVQVLDALGRQITTATTDAAGTATLVLPMGLAAGMYVVRVGSCALRLAIE